MSKLYNALEKIRTGEPGVFSAKKTTSAKGLDQSADTSRRRRVVLLGAPAMLGLALAIFFAGPKRNDVKPPITAPAVVPARAPEQSAEPALQADAPPKLSSAPPIAAPVSLAPSTGATGKDLYRQLNDTALSLIQENQYWQGIYYLEQARKQQPERPEALINMAVALAELGLRAPAQRLFSEAHALVPNHPLLRKNLELLGQADFFDPQWLSSLSAGQIQPGQATKPQ